MKSILNIFLGICLVSLLSSCKKEPSIEGPELVDIFGKFEVLSPLKASQKSVDFSKDEHVQFKVQLSIRTNWTLEVIGLNSGARKVFNGNDKDLISNPIDWNGTISFAPFFRKNEPCFAKMYFEQQPDTLYSDTVLITGIRPTPAVNILIDDFESPQRPYNTFSEGQQSYNSTAVNYQGVAPAEKSRYYVLSGNHGATASLFLCGMNLSTKISQADTNGTYFQFATENPEKIYFNAYVYGWGDSKAELSIEFQEDDNKNGIYEAAEEGTYNYKVAVNWLGWKLISFPYSATKISTSGGFGNIDRTGKKDPDRIIATQFLLLAKPGTSGITRAGIDFCSFTYNTPFQP
jgi:hypothetical protein